MLTAFSAGAVLGEATTEPHAPREPSRSVSVLRDAPIEGYRLELLEIAFEAATAMPIEPHRKNRSRAQHEVFSACLELGQSQRALAYAERIDDWRRGACYAQYAYHAAERGHTEGLDHYLGFAEAAADVAEQDWRRELIFLWIAKTYKLLGEEGRAADFSGQIKEAPHQGKVESFSASRGDEATLDSLIARLDEMIATNHYDMLRNAAAAFAVLHQQHYADTDRRALFEDRIRSAYQHMPGTDHIDIFLKLAAGALEHDDASNALRLITEARRAEARIEWQRDSEYEYTYLAKLAEARSRAGEVEQARSDLDSAMKQYQANRNRIVDIWRADALRPLAQAYQTLGDTAHSLEIYEKSVSESVVNPNSRPRAEDLAQICVSMALHGVEPDARLLARLQEIMQQLGHPW